MSNPKKPIVIKIMTSGEGGVGKTSYLHSYMKDQYDPKLRLTIGVQFFRKRYDINGKIYEIVIWDLGGQDQFRFLLNNFILGIKGAFFMFDMTNLGSLNRIDNWLEILYRYKKVPILLIGTKFDLIKTDIEKINSVNRIAIEVKERYGFINYFYTSAKEEINIETSFEYFMDFLMEKID